MSTLAFNEEDSSLIADDCDETWLKRTPTADMAGRANWTAAREILLPMTLDWSILVEEVVSKLKVGFRTKNFLA